MDRLTKRQGNSVIIPIEQKRGQTFPVENPYQKAIEKLAAYEDTGLEPEQVAVVNNLIEYLDEWAEVGEPGPHIKEAIKKWREGKWTD